MSDLWISIHGDAACLGGVVVVGLVFPEREAWDAWSEVHHLQLVDPHPSAFREGWSMSDWGTRFRESVDDLLGSPAPPASEVEESEWDIRFTRMTRDASVEERHNLTMTHFSLLHRDRVLCMWTEMLVPVPLVNAHSGSEASFLKLLADMVASIKDNYNGTEENPLGVYLVLARNHPLRPLVQDSIHVSDPQEAASIAAVASQALSEEIRQRNLVEVVAPFDTPDDHWIAEIPVQKRDIIVEVIRQPLSSMQRHLKQQDMERRKDENRAQMAQAVHEVMEQRGMDPAGEGEMVDDVLQELEDARKRRTKPHKKRDTSGKGGGKEKKGKKKGEGKKRERKGKGRKRRGAGDGEGEEGGEEGGEEEGGAGEAAGEEGDAGEEGGEAAWSDPAAGAAPPAAADPLASAAVDALFGTEVVDPPRIRKLVIKPLRMCMRRRSLVSGKPTERATTTFVERFREDPRAPEVIRLLALTVPATTATEPKPRNRKRRHRHIESEAEAEAEPEVDFGSDSDA